MLTPGCGPPLYQREKPVAPFCCLILFIHVSIPDR
jgi:hypothetical protein